MSKKNNRNNNNKKNERYRVLCDMILSYADLVKCGELFKQLDLKMNIYKTLTPVTSGSPAAQTLCNDMIKAYNDCKNYGKNLYSSNFRSDDLKDRNKYQQQYIYKDIVKVIRSKYDCGVTLSGMELEDILEGLRLFMGQVR